MTPLILDTNVFVAAGFKPHSASAAVIGAVREGARRIVWNRPTRAETEQVVCKIRKLDWNRFAGLFDPASEYTGMVFPETFDLVEDAGDRKFAALAAAAGGILITSDRHLLVHRNELRATVLTPGEYMNCNADLSFTAV